MTYRAEHSCSLRAKDITHILPPLHPNANMYDKFKRWLLHQTILDMKDKRTIEFFGTSSAMRQELKRHIKESHCVIHPFSRMSHILQVVFFITWLYQYFVVPATFAFRVKWTPTVLRIQFSTINLAQVIVYISLFITGYTKHKTKEVVVNQKKIIVRYLKTYFLFDTVAVFGLLIHEITFWNKDKKLRTHMPFYAAITVTYLVRFRTIIKYFKGTLIMMHIPKKYRFIALTVLLYLIILNTWTCILYGIPKMLYSDNNYPKGSWLSTSGLNQLEKFSLVQVYCECLIVVVCNFFGASHSHYDTSIPNENITIFLLMLFGRLYTLFGIAKLLQIFDVGALAESKYDQFMDQLQKFMRSKNFPIRFRERLMQFYQHKLKNEYFDEVKITTLLSSQLQTEIFLVGAKKLIHKLPILRSLDKVTLAHLFATMKYESFLPGDMITSYGEDLENIYFIESGTVAVYNEHDNELCHLHDGDYFGTLDVNDQKKYGTQMLAHMAIEHCEIFYLGQEVFRNFFIDRRADVLDYFNRRINDTRRKYQFLTKQVKKSRINILSDLKSGKILETPRRRPVL